jgi:hypothetical protein
VLSQQEYYYTISGGSDRKEFLNSMKDRELIDPFPRKKAEDWEILISMERQRICELKNERKCQEKDVRLFATSISLARLYQARYRFGKNQVKRDLSISTAESEEVHFAIINISDPILRIIALSIILDMKDTWTSDEEQRTKLRCEMISTLQSLLPDLSLLKSILLFVRCHTVHKHFPVPFQYMANVIGKKLNKTFIDKQNQEQQAAYIALRQLNNSDLSPYLSEFAKQTKNLSDLLQFNSTTFFRYFTNRTSFDSSNLILLSSMYLAELAFDAQILNMYVANNHKNDIPPRIDLKELWNESSKDGKIMTFQVASWITNTLQMSSKEEIFQIIDDVSHCSVIERNALSVIEKWLTYRMDKYLRFFGHYAALQLIIKGSNIPDLIDIINEMFIIDSEFCLKSHVERILLSLLVDLTVVRQILIILQRNVRYSSEISVWIDCKEIF